MHIKQVRTELETGARCFQSPRLTHCLGDATRCWAKNKLPQLLEDALERLGVSLDLKPNIKFSEFVPCGRIIFLYFVAWRQFICKELKMLSFLRSRKRGEQWFFLLTDTELSLGGRGFSQVQALSWAWYSWVLDCLGVSGQDDRNFKKGHTVAKFCEAFWLRKQYMTYTGAWRFPAEQGCSSPNTCICLGPGRESPYLQEESRAHTRQVPCSIAQLLRRQSSLGTPELLWRRDISSSGLEVQAPNFK